MSSLLEQLHDIEGLDSISWWPLAPGWWVLITLCVIILCLLAWFALSKLAFRLSWKSDTLHKLAFLEGNLSESTARETVIALSEYLRRIALRRFPRKECAGLTGEAWLKWLASRDPKSYDWVKRGGFLIDAPYAPVDASMPASEIKELIQAVKNWVR
jgi:hypothetical protein